MDKILPGMKLLSTIIVRFIVTGEIDLLQCPAHKTTLLMQRSMNSTNRSDLNYQMFYKFFMAVLQRRAFGTAIGGPDIVHSY
jgi:hypothetical protein